MRERPILFSAPMVRAILDGCKTQTRRAVKMPEGFDFGGGNGDDVNDPSSWGGEDEEGRWWSLSPADHVDLVLPCPFGRTGDRLWVRETFAPIYSSVDGRLIEVDYRATYKHGDRMGDHIELKKRWTPSIHMPRAACRLVLEVTSVRVERLQAISAADCLAEGAAGGHGAIPNYPYNATPHEHFEHIWSSTGGAWGANPFVWVIGFRIAEGPANG